MKKKINILLFVLLLQVGCIILTRVETDVKTVGGKFVEKDLMLTDKLNLQYEDAKLTISKLDNKWIIPDKNNLPVDSKKIDGLIQEISAINKTDLIASSKEAQKNLKVSDDTYSRKIEFIRDNKNIAELLFGDSSSFKRIYSRVKGNDEVYEIPFNEYRLSVDPMDWVQRDLLKISGQVNSFSVNDINLASNNGKWSSDKITAEQINQEEVSKLVSRLTSIGFDSVAFDIKDEEFNKIAKFLEFNIDNGEVVSFKFVGPYQTESLLLKVSKFPHIFKVSKSNIDGIKAISLGNLKVTK